METKQLLPALGRRPDDHEDALGFGFHPRLKINPIRPNVDVAARRQITALPAVVFLLPTGVEARDDARRQVWRILAEKGTERLLE